MIKKFKLLAPSSNIEMLTFHTYALICAGGVEEFGHITFRYTILHKLNNDIQIFTILYGTHTSTDADLRLVCVAVSRQNTIYPSPK